MKSYEKALNKFRKNIDGIDRELIRVMARRMKVVEKIGALKKKHKQPVLQSKRFGQILVSRVEAAKKLGLSGDFSRKLLKLIHTEAIRIQRRK